MTALGPLLYMAQEFVGFPALGSPRPATRCKVGKTPVRRGVFTVVLDAFIAGSSI
jgi:hypothetical protein